MEASGSAVDLDTSGPFLGEAATEPDARRLLVERVPASAMQVYQMAWQSLCDRALERNVFLEPAFALPLLQHAVFSPKPDFLLVWEDEDPTFFCRLVGLLPIVAPRLWGSGIARGFRHPQTALGTPLLDAKRAAEVLDAMLDGVRDAFPRADALRLGDLERDGAFSRLLEARCNATGRGTRHFGDHQRAVLQPNVDELGKVMPFAHAKRRKEISRQRRRLSERGVRTYTSATTAEAIARAAERFLVLEHEGWKGRRGTAMLASPALVVFTRTMTRLMGAEGKCRIDSIEVDGMAVAMGIVLTTGDRAHFWKTTYQEAFRPLSPGVQFALELTERQLKNPDITLTDSCAIPDHPMIDRLWAGRMGMTDVLIELHPGAPRRFRRACTIERMARSALHYAKKTYLRLRRALVSQRGG